MAYNNGIKKESYCDTACMEVFLKKLSKEYPNDEILLVCDGASRHRANDLDIPDNIHISFIPPGTPEMNPIEQIWKEIRKLGFRKEVFSSRHITARDWIVKCFNWVIVLAIY
ncbi:MAG: transposase [Clostridia bacterium]|nr:transposase [Clostridia bacterium]